MITTIFNRLQALGALVFPPLCHVCHCALTQGERYLCTRCIVELPISGGAYNSDRHLNERFSEIPPQAIYALFRYHKESRYSRILYHIKYLHKTDFAQYMGEFLGYYLQSLGCWDAIAAVPLHPKRQHQRGYNQAAFIALGVSKVLQIPFYPELLLRTQNTRSQTRQSTGERINSEHQLFTLGKIPEFKGNSLLLVDDVITSGTTMYGCAKALASIKDLRITLAALGRTVSS